MDILVTILLVIGFIFVFGGTVGIIRFPDFYARLHAAGKIDTLGSLAMMTALALFAMKDPTLLNVLTGLKILFCMVFVFLASPTATHAIVDAGIRAGLRPWSKKEDQ